MNINLKYTRNKKARDPFEEIPAHQVQKLTRDMCAQMLGTPEVWQVTTNLGNNYFNLHRFDKKKRNVPAEDLNAYLYINPGMSVLVVYENFDKSRPKIIGVFSKTDKTRYFATAGVWDQTWANFRHTARGIYTTSNPLNFEGDIVHVLNTGDSPNLSWIPLGILFRNTGQIWIVHLYLSGGEYTKIIAKLMNVGDSGLGSPWTVDREFEIPLTSSDRQFNILLPDSSCFYDTDNDLLHILRIPNYTTGTTGNIWTIGKINGSWRVVKSRLTIDYGAVLDTVNIAGRSLFIGNLTRNSISVYDLDVSSLKWSQRWRSNISSFGLGTGGGSYRSDLSFPPTNYSPPFNDGKFYTKMIKANGTYFVCNEVAFTEDSAAAVPTKLFEQSEHERDSLDIIKLTDCNDAYAEHFKESADDPSNSFSETRYGWFFGGVDGRAPYEYNYIVEWLGAVYETYSWDMQIWADPVTGINTLGVNHEITYTHPSLGKFPPGAPPVGMPKRGPNKNDLYERFFWRGESPDSQGPNNERNLVTADGWRYYAELVPVPVFTPNVGSSSGKFTTTKEPQCWVSSDSCGNGYDYSACGINSTNPGAGGPGNPTGTGTQWFQGKLETRRVGGYLCKTRWAYRTKIFAVSPSGIVTSRVISQDWTGGLCPAPDGGDPIVISQSLPIGENVYQFFDLPDYNMVACVCDTRDSVLSDPIPQILILSRDLQTLHHTIGANHLGLIDYQEKFTEDQIGDDGIWARKDQYLWKLHGRYGEGPQCKVFKAIRDDEECYIILVGCELEKLCEPKDGEIGASHFTHSFIKVTASSFGAFSTGAGGLNWTYPNKEYVNESIDGPKIVRTLLVAEDRCVICQYRPEEGVIIREF